MTAAPPNVSVIMTCFNEGPWIGAAVRSVLDQTAGDRIVDILIADDGSAPETQAVLTRIEGWDPRIRVLRGPGGAGPPAQRCWAIGQSRGDLIAILDGDDLWEPQKLAVQIERLADPKVGLCYSEFLAFGDGNEAAARPAGVADITDARDLARAYFLNDPPVVPSTVLMRRSAYEASGGFDPDVRVFEDTDLFVRMAAVCRFAFVAEPLAKKRYRTTSITGGRTDLMVHHAAVAFRAAISQPHLLAFVPRRLAERARKLGNHRFLLGDREGARQLLALSFRLNPVNPRTWVGWLVVVFGASGRWPVLATALRRRRLALGLQTGVAALDVPAPGADADRIPS